MFGGMFPQGAAVPPIQDRLAFQREGERDAPAPVAAVPPAPIEEGGMPPAAGEGQVDPATQQPLVPGPEGRGFGHVGTQEEVAAAGDIPNFDLWPEVDIKDPSAIDQLTALNDEIAKLFGPGGVISKGIINQY